MRSPREVFMSNPESPSAAWLRTHFDNGCNCIACEIRQQNDAERRAAETDDYVTRQPLTGEEPQ